MYYNECRQKLIDAGYLPIPIKPRDKAPAITGWTDPGYSPPPGYGGYGAGIACGRGSVPICAVDIDITDAGVAQAVSDWVLATFGETVYRIGKAPKILLVYRAERPGMKKRSSRRYSIGRVEALGDGQQFVCFGTHPETKQPYTWPGILGSILDVDMGSLPIIGSVHISAIIEHFESIALAKGLEPLSKETTTANVLDDFDPLDPLDKVEPIKDKRPDDFKRILDTLDPDCTRDEWRNVGMALQHQFGADGFDLWNEWSSGGKKYPGIDEIKRQWDSFGRYTGRPITGAYLLKLAKEKNVWVDPDFFKKLDWSTSRFLADPPAIPMIVHGFLPRGIVSLFYSAGGVGKSTIILYLAIKIAIAQEYDADFLGHAIVGGRVVIVTAEDPELILNRRFIATINGIAEELQEPIEEIRKAVDEKLSIVSTFGEDVQLFKLRTDGSLYTTDYYSSLLSCLQEVKNLQLVVIDTKTRYSPGEGEGNVVDTREVTHYEKIARTTGASIMLLHHTNKASRDGSVGGSQAYRGNTALYDSVRAAWFLRGITAAEAKDQGIPEEQLKSYLLLENSKNNYIEVNLPALIHRDGYKYKIIPMKPKTTASERKETERQRAYDTVIEVLQIARGKDFSQADIITLCQDKNLGRRKVVAAIKEAAEDDMIEQTPCKRGFRYSLTDTGRLYKTTVEG